MARRVIAARTIWRKAIRWKLTSENPFAGVRGGHQANESRKRFISREIIEAVIAEAPDAEWRVIIALARYGGLRTPSETFSLRWGDVDWGRSKIRVTCPKMAHNENCAFRTIPLFQELQKPLLELYELAEPGTEYVINRLRTGSANLRTHFERIIKRAGYEPWARLFHNLRASRESELMREYDLATVCKWIGNSPAIAARHYATSVDLDSDFRRAAGLGSNEAQQKAQQNAQQSASVGDELPLTDEPLETQNTLENKGNVNHSQLCASGSIMKDWALLDSNQ